jgi:hypothetical protein
VHEHRMWQINGCPKFGPVYDVMQRAKAAYKHALRNSAKDELVSVSNDLHDCLMAKDTCRFWQTRCVKFGNKRSVPSVVDGEHDSGQIAEKFASAFERECTVNNATLSNKLMDKFLTLCNVYNIHENVCIDVETVDRCIRKMKLGRAAGWDEIDVEHLLYAHPILVTLLSVMLNRPTIVTSGYVPQIFCRGIIIPLIKDKNGHTADINNYSGITLSSAIAKNLKCV